MFFDVLKFVGCIVLILFSIDGKVVLKFNILIGMFLNSEEVNRWVSFLECKGGLRQIDKVLVLVENEVLICESGMRDGVFRVRKV